MFKPLVDRVGLGSLVPVEFFGARNLAFLPNGSSLHTFEVGNCHTICIVIVLHVLIHNFCTVKCSNRNR